VHSNNLVATSIDNVGSDRLILRTLSTALFNFEGAALLMAVFNFLLHDTIFGNFV